MIREYLGGEILECRDEKTTHIKEIRFCVLYLGQRLVGFMNYFSGRSYYAPWVDLDYYPVPRDIEAEVFKRLSNLLDRGGRLLVSYYRDSETLYALRKGINPVLTPIGFSMLRAGMTWFKDLYFPEGGNESGPRLQGSKPTSEEECLRQLRERLWEIEEFKSLSKSYDRTKAEIERILNERGCGKS